MLMTLGSTAVETRLCTDRLQSTAITLEKDTHPAPVFYGSSCVPMLFQAVKCLENGSLGAMRPAFLTSGVVCLE